MLPQNDNQKINGDISPSNNRIPEHPVHIHLMGICGTGMASLAGMLKQLGHNVTGSDQNVYPPMSILLQSLSIPVMKGYSASNLEPAPDLVIVGNIITRNNPEAQELVRLELPYVSFPQALNHFAFKDKKTIVVSGTHGKTTTSSLMAWVLEKAGMEPGFMIGGIPHNFTVNFKIGNGEYFVIEGDEYDTAFFDKGPKFLHYNPYIVILTSIEYDHADIYRDLEHVKESFIKLIELVPPSGLIVANNDDMVISSLTERAKCRVITYGLNKNADFNGIDINTNLHNTGFSISRNGVRYADMSASLYGHHNISNILSVVGVSDFLHIKNDDISLAIRQFEGVKRRQEIIGEKSGILILDDFAHHPTAVKATINGVRKKYKDHRLVAVFEPRSNSSRRNVFQEQYAQSFADADIVFVPEPSLMEKIPLSDRFSSKLLVDSLNARGVTAFHFLANDTLLTDLAQKIYPGDIVLFMSNGSFDNLPRRFLQTLEKK